MPSWPASTVGSHATQRLEKVAVKRDHQYETMGVRWYGKGAYLRPGSQPKTSTLNRARNGDVVFCRIDTQNGPFAVVPESLDESLVSNEFPIYSVNKASLDPQFLVLCFLRSATLETIGRLREGRDGRARWKERDFESWPIPLPPLADQRRIVEIVTAIDETIGALDAERAAADIALAALMDKLLAFRDGWERTILKDVATWTSGSTPAASNRAFYDNGSTPWAIIGDVQNRPIDATTRQITTEGLEAIGGKRKLVPVGSVLVTMYGTVGRTAVVGTEMATNQAIARGVPGPKVSSDFLFNWIRARQSQLEQLAEGKTQQNISKAKIESFRIDLPSLDEQDRIAKTLGHVDENTRALQAEAQRLRTARAAVLDGLLTRQIVA